MIINLNNTKRAELGTKKQKMKLLFLLLSYHTATDESKKHCEITSTTPIIPQLNATSHFEQEIETCVSVLVSVSAVVLLLW